MPSLRIRNTPPPSPKIIQECRCERYSCDEPSTARFYLRSPRHFVNLDITHGSAAAPHVSQQFIVCRLRTLAKKTKPGSFVRVERQNISFSVPETGNVRTCSRLLFIVRSPRLSQRARQRWRAFVAAVSTRAFAEITAIILCTRTNLQVSFCCSFPVCVLTGV